MTNRGNRIKEMDIMKGIGIILVLLGHSGFINGGGYIRDLIYGFHIPLFFFCSGFFYRKRTILDNIKRSTLQLIIPYLFFLMILLGTYFIFNLWNTHNLLLSLKIALLKLGYPIDIGSSYYLTIWFLICLFLVRIIFDVINLFAKGNRVAYLLIALISYIVSSYIDTPLLIDTAFCGLSFYILGTLFSKSSLVELRINKYYLISIVVVYCISVFVLKPFVDLKYNIFPWYYCVLAALGIYIMYQCSLILKTDNSFFVSVLIKCGECSLVIFGLHRPLWMLFNPFIIKFNFNTIFSEIILVCLTIPVCFLLFKILARFTPIMIGIGRK